ncbi:Peptide methionine sulfoxide reductase MsrB [Marinomonas gallaica]|uniref:peptide-methionine (R)-S-oxide reductase n=1 Tax=Marinomonas gallaica TaxID=1806667 RepID=A0A1C3JSH9_9GAMM|nr:peptide-methionine (R)-S-oxide reductase MsrB [Marinomonas gallaica]SBT18087.1 Peptide methionine sulfoxide reductase MsrB [Marinomonas gallaica]SBT22467.1 Peptide methionine sulfoxide reductase MsrB [Marinomonas gallaica]
MNRRHFLKGTLAVALMSRGMTAIASAVSEANYEITRTEAEWRTLLTDFEYQVMREEATERAYSSPLNDEKRTGLFHCKGCELPLYDSATKFDSGTGWPSFYDSLPNAVSTKDDRSWFVTRTEVHCRRCGSHMGHIFEDGPKPTGLRHCINGVAMTFHPN